MKRRQILQGALAIAGSVGLLRSVVALALEWPKTAFEAESEADALSAVFGDAEILESTEVKIIAPLQAENGAVVPIKVATTLPEPRSIAIMVEKNPVPLISKINLGPGAKGFYSARIKMGETSNVTAYVESGGKIHSASQEIKVTVGGCGG